MIKKIGSVVGLLILVVLVLPVFLSSHFSMSRSIEIQAPIGTVFSKLTNLNEYTKWNPFPEGDPTNQTNVTGDGLNSFMVWKGDKTGEGKMTITNIEPDKKVEIKMEFYKPMTSEGVVRWILNPKSDSTTEMVWTFDQDLYYFNRYFGLFMDAMMGKHFEKGLSTYKAIVEASK
jgi:uncharacterized protein YndB with AHSA1/START domain